MRPGGPQYPVDRYLVESSKKIEMVNIIDDIWNPEPSLRPEEEIILRKLHEMLQSTADDLKLLSGELTRSREPGIFVRAAPAPLDDEFNEKVHIEEVVNAKFHGYELVDKPPKLKRPELINKPKINVLGNMQNSLPIGKTTARKRLTKSRTKVVQINATPSTKHDKVEEVKIPVKETVAYSEFSYEYPKPKVERLTKGLQVQLMPSINIRSELKEQKVLHLDIMPESVNDVDKTDDKSNVGVVIVQYEAPTPTLKAPQVRIQQDFLQTKIIGKKATRKVTKMVTCESSSSSNNVRSDHCNNVEIPLLKNIRAPAKTAARIDRSKYKNNKTSKTEPPKRTYLNLDEWKNKLNSVYGQPSSSQKNKSPSKSKVNVKNVSPKKTNIRSAKITKPQPRLLNNAQYIPYSQLTLGGVNVSDIEREISNIPNRSNMPLSPILDKIISSQENSRHNSPRKNKQGESPKILTTSDENLLQEVLEIEHTVGKTLSKNLDIKLNDLKAAKVSSDSTNADNNEPDSYADDFEDEKSDKANSGKTSPLHELQAVINSSDSKNNSDECGDSNVEYDKLVTTMDKSNVHNLTYSKPTLTLKNSVETYEYIHAIDRQDTATQSHTTDKISLKETQTSPRNVATNVPVQPIHNDLRPVVDPSKEVEKMFELEKDLIKKLIIDEYGDLIQRSIDKPSTSKRNQESLNTGMNMVASQKVTQTSPKLVKSVMTSPTKTKTRTTSPFRLSLAVDHHTSPMVLVTNEEQDKTEVEEEQEPEDLGISINLSSPRFSLRLPNTSLEVLSNLEICSRTLSNVSRKNTVRKESSDKLPKPVRKIVSSSSSLDADKSSSEISSLGEVKFKLRRRLKKRVPSLSESTSSTSSSLSKLSVDFNSASILPLRSEGEVTSIPRPSRNTSHTSMPSKSDGEISFGKPLA